MWIRARSPGSRSRATPSRSAGTRAGPDSLSSSDTRMLSGILRVFAKTRPALPAGSPERAILDRQVARFEMELLAAEARASLQRGDGREAARHLAALHARRGGWTLRLASGVATPAPWLALAAYRLRVALRQRRTTRTIRIKCRAWRSGQPSLAAHRIGDPRGLDPRRARSIASIRPSGTGPARDACWSTCATRCTPPCSSRSPSALERDPRVAVFYTVRAAAARSAIAWDASRPAASLTHQQAALAPLGSVSQRRSVDPSDAAPLRALRQRLSRRRRQVRPRQPGAPADRVPPVRSRAVHQSRSDGRGTSSPGLVSRERAVLVGFPKVDRLVNGEYDAAAIRRALGLDAGPADGALRADLVAGVVAERRRRGDHHHARRRRLERHRQAALAVARRADAEVQRRRSTGARAWRRSSGPAGSCTSRMPTRRRCSRPAT